MAIPFFKMVASGNDFILLDNTSGQLSSYAKASEDRPITNHQLPELAKEVCQRRKSVGADGLLLLEDSSRGDFKMRVFNPDGSEVDMCGNGARCAALYYTGNQPAWRHRHSGPGRPVTSSQQLNIETRAGILEAVVDKNLVRIKMSDPKDLKLNFALKLDDFSLKANFVNTGVPHVVCVVENLDGFNVLKIGSQIRYHKEFSPDGTNADFVTFLDDETIKLRTYERGVEDETLACGTGAVAAAIVYSYLGSGVKPGVKQESQINVHTRSGEVLKVYFDRVGQRIENVYLEGGAKLVYEGRLEFNLRL